MKKNYFQSMITLVSIIVCSINLIIAQSKLPAFTKGKVQLRIPTFMPGIMADSTVATYTNDTMNYTLNGYLFKDGGFRVPVNTKPVSIKSSTPWETITEMANAYLQKDTKSITSLYGPSSKNKIENILYGKQKNEFLDYLSKCENVTILGGFDYHNGFMVITKDNAYGIHENYLVKESNQYKLEALDDKAVTSWNVSLYYKFNPKPMITNLNASFPDSIKLFDSTRISCVVPEPGRWISVYLNQLYGPTLMLIQDNGQNDMDATPGKITFSFKAISLMTKGMKDVYMASFNFPVQKVSPSIVVNAAKHILKVY